MRIDAAKMTPVLRQMVKNENTQDSGTVYTQLQADSILEFS